MRKLLLPLLFAFLSAALPSSATTYNALDLGVAVAFASAQDGDTVWFPAGTYTAPVGTTYVITKNIIVQGPLNPGKTATLINIRLLLHSPVISINHLTMNEVDCYADEQMPVLCPAAIPMVTLGDMGYPVTLANVTNVTLNYTRAYTGIAMGLDATQNVTLQHIVISDGDMSGVSVFQGSNIQLTDIEITGSPTSWVDDGIAITSYTGPINNLVIENSTAAWTADLIGLGAQMSYPMTNITIQNSTCSNVWYCMLNKTSIQSQNGQSQEVLIDNFLVRNMVSK